MTTIVVDASVVAKWFFPEDLSRESQRLLSPRNTLLAPELIWSEFGNIAWKHVRRGELQADEAAQIIAELIRLPITIAQTQVLLAPAVEIAIAIDRTVYDCMYLALAIDRNCRLVSADERFVNALAPTPFARHVRHVSKIG